MVALLGAGGDRLGHCLRGERRRQAVRGDHPLGTACGRQRHGDGRGADQRDDEVVLHAGTPHMCLQIVGRALKKRESRPHHTLLATLEPTLSRKAVIRATVANWWLVTHFDVSCPPFAMSHKTGPERQRW